MKAQLGNELLDIIECPECRKTVLAESRAAAGFLAPCGRRLVNLAECGDDPLVTMSPSGEQHVMTGGCCRNSLEPPYYTVR